MKRPVFLIGWFKLKVREMVRVELGRVKTHVWYLQ